MPVHLKKTDDAASVPVTDGSHFGRKIPGADIGRLCKSGYESGGLAQLARAPALQAGGQRFESVILHSL